MLSRLNHVAIAVRDLPTTIRFYEEAFGLMASPISEFPSQGVCMASIILENVKIEFISPLNPLSPISNFLAKRGDSLHHITLETLSIQKEMDDMKKKGIRTLSDTPVTGHEGSPIIFLNPKDTRGVLIELEETARK